MDSYTQLILSTGATQNPVDLHNYVLYSTGTLFDNHIKEKRIPCF